MPSVPPAHLQYGVGLQQPVLDGLHLVTGGAGNGVVLQDLLGGLRLARPALARDQDALIPALRAHGAIRVVRRGVAVEGGDMWVHIRTKT